MVLAIECGLTGYKGYRYTIECAHVDAAPAGTPTVHGCASM